MLVQRMIVSENNLFMLLFNGVEEACKSEGKSDPNRDNRKDSTDPAGIEPASLGPKPKRMSSTPWIQFHRMKSERIKSFPVPNVDA